MSGHATHLSPNILSSQGYNDEVILLHGKVWEHWAVHKRNLTTAWMYGKFGNKCVQKAGTASLASTLSSWKDRNNKKISWTITRCSTQKKNITRIKFAPREYNNILNNTLDKVIRPYIPWLEGILGRHLWNPLVSIHAFWLVYYSRRISVCKSKETLAKRSCLKDESWNLN